MEPDASAVVISNGRKLYTSLRDWRLTVLLQQRFTEMTTHRYCSYRTIRNRAEQP